MSRLVLQDTWAAPRSVLLRSEACPGGRTLARCDDGSNTPHGLSISPDKNRGPFLAQSRATAPSCWCWRRRGSWRCRSSRSARSSAPPAASKTPACTAARPRAPRCAKPLSAVRTAARRLGVMGCGASCADSKTAAPELEMPRSGVATTGEGSAPPELHLLQMLWTAPGLLSTM